MVKSIFYLIFFTYASIIFGQSDTIEAEGNFDYSFRARVDSIISCKEDRNAIILKITIDSILYFDDSTFYLNKESFQRCVKYVYSHKSSNENSNCVNGNILSGEFYYFHLYTGFTFTNLKIVKLSKRRFVLKVKARSGNIYPSSIGNYHYYKMRKFLRFYYLKVLRRKDQYNKFPFQKTHKIVKARFPRYVNCIPDFYIDCLPTR